MDVLNRSRKGATYPCKVLIIFGIYLLGVGCGPQPTGSDTNYDPYERPDAEPLQCVPDLDGEIAADEFEPAIGVAASYLVSPAGQTRSVDLVGQKKEGKRVWDWSRTRQSDQSLEIAAESIDEKWYAGSFPDGQFSLPVDLSGRTEGIYRKTDSRMFLLGLASRRESPGTGKTLLVYEEPVVVYKFPVKTGRQWVSVGNVNDGTLRGSPYAGRDTYEVKVQAVGEIKLPNFTFEQVHRVDTKVTVQPAAGKSVARRQVSFVAECFGEVARATSEDGVTEKSFEEAAEVRRLGVRR